MICPNLLGGCHGTTGPSSIDPRHRPGLRPPLPASSPSPTSSRCTGVCSSTSGSRGSTAPSAARSAGCRCCSGRSTIPGEIDARRPRLRLRTPDRAEHRLLGGRREPQSSATSTSPAATTTTPAASPRVGLTVARMMAHITYVSEDSLQHEVRAGADRATHPHLRRRLRRWRATSSTRASSSCERFDANTYLYLTRVMDYFDPFADEDAACAPARRRGRRSCGRRSTRDWRFPTPHSREIERVLRRAGCDVVREEVASPWGHDSFLLEVQRYHELVTGFLATPRPSLRAPSTV